MLSERYDFGGTATTTLSSNWYVQPNVTAVSNITWPPATVTFTITEPSEPIDKLWQYVQELLGRTQTWPNAVTYSGITLTNSTGFT